MEVRFIKAGESGPLKLYKDDRGWFRFEREVAKEIALRIFNDGGFAQVFDGKTLIYEPSETDWEKDLEEGEAREKQYFLSQKLMSEIHRLITGRYCGGETTYQSDALGSLRLTLNHCGLLTLPEELNDDRPTLEMEVNDIRRSLATTPVELALSFIARALLEPDVEKAEVELTTAMMWASRAVGADLTEKYSEENLLRLLDELNERCREAQANRLIRESQENRELQAAPA